MGAGAVAQPIEQFPYPGPHKLGLVMPVILALKRWRLEDQKVKVILSYTMSLRLPLGT